ncbi:hypothetical protein [Nocardia nepalensis]|uniref:hypothetical protein n=1 Tax=Nocardia nepalensis TaxID=3375448 RepID=UPI003B6706F4
MRLTINHRGIWIPWTEANPGVRAEHEAALIRRVKSEGVNPAAAIRVAGALGGNPFGLGNDRTVTPKSRKMNLPRGLVFVDYPTIKEMAMAVDWARGGVLAVLEGPPGVIRLPLAGWAAAVGAVDALTGEPAQAVSDEVRSLFDRLVQYGNNGYGDRRGNYFVRELVPEIAADIRAAGYTNDFIASYLLAYGLDEDNEKSLRKVIGSITV